MKRVFLYLSCLAAIFFYCQTELFAENRSDKLKPKWITHALPQSSTGNYIFIRAHGEGYSLMSAKQVAFVSMSQKLETERGLTVNSNVRISEKFSQSQSSTDTEYRQEITLDVTESGRQLKIVCREIDDYWVEKNGRYEVDVLYTVADKNNFKGCYDDMITVTTKYGAAGLMSVIPGVGQIYKGSITKGSLIIAGEIAIIGGIILCENTRASYIKKMHEQPRHAAEYNSLADSWETGRNICIGAASAVYAYNIIDALVSTGAKRIIVQKRHTKLDIRPYTDTNCIGIGLALTFR